MGYLEGSYLPCKESGYNYRSQGLILSTNQYTKKTMNTSGPHSHPSRYFSLDSQKIVRNQSWIFLRTLGIFVCSKA
jgi:hypothetical protein